MQILIIFLALWSIVGLVMFCLWGVEYEGIGGAFDYCNWKQITFISLLCGPLAFGGLVIFGLCSGAFLLGQWIFEKLGD